MRSNKQNAPQGVGAPQRAQYKAHHHYTLDVRVVKARAENRWIEILGALAPELNGALASYGRRHTSCPHPTHTNINNDAFRVFYDVNLTGGGICNSCGPFSDGFKLLMWINNWTFPETLRAVHDYLEGR